MSGVMLELARGGQSLANRFWFVRMTVLKKIMTRSAEAHALHNVLSFCFFNMLLNSVRTSKHTFIFSVLIQLFILWKHFSKMHLLTPLEKKSTLQIFKLQKVTYVILSVCLQNKYQYKLRDINFIYSQSKQVHRIYFFHLSHSQAKMHILYVLKDLSTNVVC